MAKNTRAVFSGVFYFCVVLALSTSAFAGVGAEGGLCCARTAVFPPVQMPPEQETSAHIPASVYGVLREKSIWCDVAPIQYEEKDWGGRTLLDGVVDATTALAGVPPDPEAQQVVAELLDNNFAWRADLKLGHIDKRIPGEWVEGYDGEPYFEPGTLWGDWTLKLALLNLHFNEIVQEAEVSWNGLAGGWTSKGWETGSKENAIKEMVRAHFSPITEIIYDYERIPREAQVIPRKKVIGSREQMTIQVQSIQDHQSSSSRPWQRVVVEVKKGQILNGTPLHIGDRKLYAFEVGQGSLELKYKSPDECLSATETVTVYNSCDWGRAPVPVPLTVTHPQQEIANTTFEIICISGKLEFWEHFEHQALGDCTTEEPVDTMTFRLKPTTNACLFEIVGSTSDKSLYKLFCHRISGGGCPQELKTWTDQERQTRISGGFVDIEDTTRPPFRPKIEHLRSYTRCEARFSTCITPERPHGIGCGPRAPETTGWVKDPSRYMPLKNGYVDRSTSVDGQGMFYRLLIDETPFRALEQRCKASSKSTLPSESGMGEASGSASVLELSASGGVPNRLPQDGQESSLNPLQKHLSALLPEQPPEGWSAAETAFSSAQFAARVYVRGPANLHVALYEYRTPSAALRKVEKEKSRGGLEDFSVQSRPAAKGSDKVLIVVGRYLLSLRGNTDLISQFLPHLRLQRISG